MLVRLSMIYVLVTLGVIASLQLMDGRFNRTVSREPTSTEPRMDLYGNEISNAVGDYRVDRRGNLYERHAPDTAVLKVGPPRT